MADQLTEGVAVEDHGSGGLPQLEAADWAPQLVWLLISFALLYVMMSRVALPKIGEVIEARRDKIADDLDRAAELKKDAEEALKAYEQSLAEARTKAHGIATDTRDKVKAETDQLKADNDAVLAKQMENAEARINETKQAALANVRNIATDTAQVIVEKLIGKSVESSAVAAAVDAELGSRAKG